MDCVSSIDIEKAKKELAYFYSRRKLFLILALISLGLGVLIAIIASFFSNTPAGQIFLYLGSLGITGGIVLFIVRAAVYNRRIRNRKELIANYQKQQ